MVTQTGTFSRVRKIFTYSSSERSSTFFCQMSQVAQRDGQLYVTDTVRLTGTGGILRGAYRLPVSFDRVLPLDRAREGFERMAAGDHFGKIVLTS